MLPEYLVSRSEAERFIAPFAVDLAEIAELAWQDWKQSVFYRSMQHPRVRAVNVWNQIVTHGKERFYGRKDIRVDKMGHISAGFVIGDRFFIRPKYGNTTLVSRNYPTQSALDFNNQDCDLFQGIGRLEFVYTLNDLETELAEVYLVHRHKKAVAWFISLMGEPDSSQMPIPYIPPLPGGSPADRIIKPKRPASDHEQSDRRKGDGTGL